MEKHLEARLSPVYGMVGVFRPGQMEQSTLESSTMTLFTDLALFGIQMGTFSKENL